MWKQALDDYLVHKQRRVELMDKYQIPFFDDHKLDIESIEKHCKDVNPDNRVNELCDKLVPLAFTDMIDLEDTVRAFIGVLNKCMQEGNMKGESVEEYEDGMSATITWDFTEIKEEEKDPDISRDDLILALINEFDALNTIKNTLHCHKKRLLYGLAYFATHTVMPHFTLSKNDLVEPH